MVVTERLARFAATQPSAIALSCGDRQLTYAQLHDRSDALADVLRTRGVGAESIVGVRLPHSVELVVCLLAIFKAGGCYLPLDVTHPQQRSQFQIDDSGMKLLICDASAVQLSHSNRLELDDPAVRALLVGAGAPERSQAMPHPSPEQAAYIIYTSGTSGQPKGCVVTHANLIGLLDAAQPFFDFGPTDIWTLFHSFAFDFSVWEIWGALSFGGRLVIVPDALRRDPKAMVQLLEQERVTVLNQTPTAFGQLLQVQRLFADAQLALRYVIFGGEALSISSLAPWLENFGDSQPQLINMYGITETTVHVTLRPIRRSDLARSSESLIGAPLPGSVIHLLDADLQPVSAGDIGEIVVGGWGVSRGYLNRDALTAERFIPNPDGAGRLYRSGDLGRRLDNGEIVYLGRADQQVKLRGYRIELGEIEAALLHHSCINQARVICREDRPGQQMLVAYVVPAARLDDADQAALVSRLRQDLELRLPAYMVPSSVLLLESLPLTVNGKLDRQALPAPQSSVQTHGSPLSAECAWRLDRQLTHQLIALSTLLDASLQELLLASLCILFGQWRPHQRQRVAVSLNSELSILIDAPHPFAFPCAFDGLLAIVKSVSFELDELNGNEVEVPAWNLIINSSDSVLSGSLHYDASLFSAEGAARILARWQTLLTSIVFDPAATIDALPMLPASEREHLLSDWTASSCDFGVFVALQRLIEHQVALQPEAVALVQGSKTMTFSELNQRANQLAWWLLANDVGSGDVVGVCFERSFELVVVLLAVVKANAVFLLLDPAVPALRMQQKLAQLDVACVLTQSYLQPSLFAGFSDVHVIDLGADLYADQPLCNLPFDGVHEAAAYVLFTSGSSGFPKGAINSRRGLNNQLLWMRQAFGLGPRDAVLLSTPLGFDPCIADLFASLISGSRLVLMPPGVERDPRLLLQVIQDHAVNVMDVVPSLLRILLQHAEFRRCHSLRHVLCGGEAMDANLIHSFVQSGLTAQLHNLYGPSETAITAAHWPCVPLARDAQVPIGRPIANVRIYVLDAQQQPVSVGMTGELCIAGVQVGLGYVANPDLTSERFCPDPFVHDSGAVMYRSGDRARWRSDGCLEFLGRFDDQVKIRGQRVELGDVEAALLRHPSVCGCAALVRHGSSLHARLVAYVMLSQPVATSVLQTHLAALLPQAWLPQAIVVLDELPLNSNGKVSRRALEELDDAFECPEPDRAPSTQLADVEAWLARQWSQLLGVEHVGRDDHFFELGGHSLLAMQLQARFAQIGKAMDVATLYANPTIASLASALHQSNAGAQQQLSELNPDTSEVMASMQATDSEAADSIAAGDIEDLYPLTPLQEGMVYHHRLATAEQRHPDPYVIAVVMQITSDARFDDYKRVLQAAIHHHPILRTRFAWEGLAEPLQMVCRQAALPVEEVDLETLLLNPRDVEADPDLLLERLQAFTASKRHTIDIRRAPLLRLIACKDPNSGSWVVIRQYHHLITDHVSEELLEQDLKQRLQGMSTAGVPAPSFRPVVDRARQSLLDSSAQRYFGDLLGSFSEPTLPFGLSLRPDEQMPLREHHQPLNAALTQSLRATARSHGVSVATIFHLAWGLVLARCSNTSDVTFGTVLFGRFGGHEAFARVLGPCINALPVRMHVAELTVLQGLQQVQEQLNALIRYEAVPLTLAQSCSGVEPPTPLFTALINYRYSATGGVDPLASHPPLAPGITCIRGEQERTHYPFVLSVDDHQSALALTLQVEASVDPQHLACTIETTLASLVEQLDQTPDQPLDRIQMLSAAEEHLLLGVWNDTQRPYPACSSIDALFVAQVDRDPTAIAVETFDDRLSYGELDALAEDLAQRLQQQGVGVETVVGVCLDRSIAMVVALLGVLRAGGVYLPLDPAMPEARRRLLLSEAQCGLLLEHSDQVLSPLGLASRMADPACCADPVADAGRRLAYISFTSGSTGTPKGVAVEQRSVNRLVINNAALPFSPEERVLQLAPLAFDAATFEIWGPLLNGGTLVLHPPQQPSPRELAACLRERRITTLWLTAGLFHLMVEEECTALQQVPRVVAGGDRLNPKHVRRFLAGLPDGHVLINGYGPTENTTFTCCYRMDNSTPIGATVPIGNPISNTQVLVLDPARKLVPVGAVGELYIAGDGLARGYLHRPELTSDRFLELPASVLSAHGAPEANPASAIRLYRSGDLVSWRSDGMLLFHGRSDQQLKLRGYRIEPEEIEAALQQLPEVERAMVLCLDDAVGTPQLIGYVSMAHQGDGSSAVEPLLQGTALRERLKTTLPAFMVPAQIVVLPQFPVNANGKVDRAALPSPWSTPQQRAAGSRQVGFDHTFGLDPLAVMVLDVWRDVLGIDEVGAQDNFFELGGHSLAAARVVARLDQRLPTQLSPADLFRYPTPMALVERLRESDDQNPDNPMVTMKQGHGGRPLFLIHGMFGDVFGYVDFVRALPSNQPVFGVQLPKAWRHKRGTPLEAFADHYARWIRQCQSEGPYHLMGGSAGGWMAYAVAAALQQQGQRIGRLILLDTLANPHLRKTTRFRMLKAYGKQRLLRTTADRVHEAETLRDLRLMLAPRWRRRTLLERLGPVAHRWVGDDHTDASLAMVRRYRPPRLALDIDLLTPRSADDWALRFWWDLVDGDVHIHPLFERHADFFAAAHAPMLAEVVQQLLLQPKPSLLCSA